MKKRTDSITSLPPAPADDRHRRVVEYVVMMSIRVLCIVVCVVLAAFRVSFWWILVPALGAVFLPYFAVVTANAARTGGGTQPLRPGSIVRIDDDGRPRREGEE